MKLIQITEGKARILIPDPKEYSKEGKYDPSWAPVFYNPKMEFNRSISVITVSILGPKSIVDALSATGVRGIRYYIESGSNIQEIIFNDKNPLAVKLITENLKLNDVNNGKVLNKDANALLYEIKADFVDIDPFGSPSPFILSSINATKRNGVVAYTATDLSPLQGTSRTSCRRKYDAEVDKLSFSREVGLRVLIGKIVREAAILEKSVTPLFSFFKDYYYRIFAKVEAGAKKADNALDKLGYLYECMSCGYFFTSKSRNVDKCPRCSSTSLKIAGPLWLGKLNDISFLEKLRTQVNKFSYVTSFNEIMKLLDVLLSESKYDLIGYYRLDSLASKLKRNIPPREKLLECLGDGTVTHFDYRSIKTNKSFDEVLECIKTSSSN
ncbi:MAG: tRNA (guanine(26)-N(2))-dimethyltransferase [Sulfolobaceae archaeon]|nr:tRNA (guanine(26)-N(2))-dimethyltransferase [Sulfolobaceae archaeon]